MDEMITRQEQEQLTGDEVSLWTLGSLMTALKMESPNASIVTNMGTWQKYAN